MRVTPTRKHSTNCRAASKRRKPKKGRPRSCSHAKSKMNAAEQRQAMENPNLATIAITSYPLWFSGQSSQLDTGCQLKEETARALTSLPFDFYSQIVPKNYSPVAANLLTRFYYSRQSSEKVLSPNAVAEVVSPNAIRKVVGAPGLSPNEGRKVAARSESQRGRQGSSGAEAEMKKLR